MNGIVQEYLSKILVLISGNQIPFDSGLHGALPTESGIYRIFEKDLDWSKSIYIGETGDLQRRIYDKLFMGNRGDHTLINKLIRAGVHPNEESVKQYLEDSCLVQILLAPGEDRDRILFEHFAISILKPKYND